MNYGFFHSTSVTLLISGSTTSANSALPGPGPYLRVANRSGQIVRIEFGDANVLAKTPTGVGANAGSIGIANGVTEFLRVPKGATNFAFCLDAATGNVEFTSGEIG